MTAVIQTRPSEAAQEASPAPLSSSDRLSRALALGAVAGALGFAGAVVLSGSLDPGYDHRSEAISALASVQSHSAGVMTAGFLSLILATLAAGAALFRSLPNKTGRAAGVLVFLAGLGMVVVTFARQSCSNLQRTCLDRESASDVATSHVVHNLASLVVFILLVAGGFLLAAALRRTPRLRYLAVRARVAALASLLLMLWFGSGAFGNNGGLVQRAFLASAFGLPIVVALRASRRAS